MEYAFRRKRIVAAAVVAAVAIGGIVVALADDRSKGPVDTNQGVTGKADMGSQKTMPAGDPASEFHRAFKSAASATERQDMVMKACEDEVINSRMSLNDLKKLFGDSPLFIVYPIDEKTGKQSAHLSFSPPQPQPTAGPFIKEPRHGWYMWFFFERGDLTLYYFTNYRK